MPKLTQDELNALPLISSQVLGDRIRSELIGRFHELREDLPILEELVRRGMEWERLTKKNAELQEKLDECTREQLFGNLWKGVD